MSLTLVLSLALSAAPVAEAPRPALTSEQAAAEYEKRALFYSEFVAVSDATGARVTQWTDIVQGKYKRKLEAGEFFDLVGRKDLAGAWQSRMRLRNGLWIGGGSVMAASVLVPVALALSDTENLSTAVTVGLIGMPVGLGLAFAGIIINNRPLVPDHELREMADGYNQQLRNELGLERPQAPAPSSIPVREVRFAPYITGSGAGLALGGRF
ncbi:hypothetical protein ACLESD_06200 [Pyxidicoccus sp. 3LFB2]